MRTHKLLMNTRPPHIITHATHTHSYTHTCHSLLVVVVASDDRCLCHGDLALCISHARLPPNCVADHIIAFGRLVRGMKRGTNCRLGIMFAQRASVQYCGWNTDNDSTCTYPPTTVHTQPTTVFIIGVCKTAPIPWRNPRNVSLYSPHSPQCSISNAIYTLLM